METVYHRLDRRISNAQDRFIEIIKEKSKSSQEDNWARTESLVNHTWQIWSLFCRQLVMISALGGSTRSGTIVPSCVHPASPGRVAYIASCAFSGNSIKPNKIISSAKKEPTWGNVDKLNDIINALNTHNKISVLSALSTAHRGSAHLQTVRNCTMHMCGESFNEIRAIRPYYNAAQLRHPCDTTFWIDPNTGQQAFLSWIADMRQAGYLATT